MKRLTCLLFLPLLLSFAFLEDLYKVELKTIDGEKLNLSDFKGKKIMFVTLPASDQDTSLSLQELAELGTRHNNSLVIIGIPAEDFGYKHEDKAKLKKKYKDQKSNFILVEGMKVKKGAGNEQSYLFQWLTHKEKNRHFDQEIEGAGHKFFVDEKGELYAVMGPRIPLSNPVIERILSKKIKQ